MYIFCHKKKLSVFLKFAKMYAFDMFGSKSRKHRQQYKQAQ